MNGPDFRQQENSEREHAAYLLDILRRVAWGESTINDAVELAIALGLSKYFQPQENTA